MILSHIIEKTLLKRYRTFICPDLAGIPHLYSNISRPRIE
jgi:hypothetical protein